MCFSPNLDFFAISFQLSVFVLLFSARLKNHEHLQFPLMKAIAQALHLLHSVISLCLI